MIRKENKIIKLRCVTSAALAGIFLFLLAACGWLGSAVSDPLDDSSWVLVAFRKTSPIPGTTITATFEDGRIHGSAGCNSYGGTYQVKGDKITVGAIATTMMACLEPKDIIEQEVKFRKFISDAQTFRLIDGQLQIFRSDGEALTFVPHE